MLKGKPGQGQGMVGLPMTSPRGPPLVGIANQTGILNFIPRGTGSQGRNSTPSRGTPQRQYGRRGWVSTLTHHHTPLPTPSGELSCTQQLQVGQ